MNQKVDHEEKENLTEQQTAEAAAEAAEPEAAPEAESSAEAPEEETAKDKAQDNQEAIIADDTADIEIAQNTTIDTSTLQNDEVNVENVQKEEEGKSKKLSNHKRKLAMKRVGSASPVRSKISIRHKVAANKKEM